MSPIQDSIRSWPISLVAAVCVLSLCANADVIASYNSDTLAQLSNGPQVDVVSIPTPNWSTSILLDRATGTGASGESNTETENRALRNGSTGNYLNFSSEREGDSGVPAAPVGESTWLTFSVTPNPTLSFNFTGHVATIDTYVNSNSNPTSTDWTLYFRTNSGSAWTSLGTQAGASVSGAGAAGPVGITWDLTPIGIQLVEVQFLVDPVSTGSTSGLVGQHGTGLDNLTVNADVTVIGSVIASYGFDTVAVAIGQARVDVDISAQLDWSTSDLVDQATGTGAQGVSNKGSVNRNFFTGASGDYLAFGATRENDGGVPDGPIGESTWLQFSTVPNPGTVFDFGGQVAHMGTYAASTTANVSRGDWTLYFSLNGGSIWTALQTVTGISAAAGMNAGPLDVCWDLSPIGVSFTRVDFVIDPVTTGFNTGSVTQRHTGLDNLTLRALIVSRTISESCNGDGGDQMGCTNCPCMNNAAPGTIGGCLNSAGTSTRIYATGDTSTSLPTGTGTTTDLRFNLDGAPGGAFCVLLSGSALGPQNMGNLCFGLGSGVQSLDRDGLRCAVMNLKRHGGRSANMLGEIDDSAGPSRVWGGEAQPHGGIYTQGGFAAGETRYFQVTHREDPTLGCMRGLNTSQAIGITFTP